MTRYDARDGIKAKQVFLHFTDAVYNTNNNISLSSSNFTSNKFKNFWCAYYGDDMTVGSVNYSIANLGFPSGTAGADVIDDFGTQAYDTIANVDSTGKVLTLTTNTSMTADAQIGKYVIIKKADGKLVFGRITDNDASTITLDQDVGNEYGVASNDTILLLKVPFGLTMTAWHRIDHIADDFKLTPPKTEANDKYFLGTSDDTETQNSVIDKGNPSKLSGSMTIRGGVSDLLRLKYSVLGTSPSGTKRYNLGDENDAHIGFIAFWTSSKDNMESEAQITKGVFCNNITITSVNILDEINTTDKATATVEFEVRGGNAVVETYEVQVDNPEVNN